MKVVTIGDNSVIANSSVVTKTVVEDVIVGGYPLEIKKYLKRKPNMILTEPIGVLTSQLHKYFMLENIEFTLEKPIIKKPKENRNIFLRKVSKKLRNILKSYSHGDTNG